MDTARAQTVLNNQELMPNFYQLAEEGTLFTNAFTTAPWTLPSHASLFTGQYTESHETHAGSKFFNPKVPTIAELLRQNGYDTVAFSNNAWISPEFGFDRGFDTFKTGFELVNCETNLISVAKENQGALEQAKAVGETLINRNAHRTIINAIYAKFFRGRYDDGARLTNWRVRRWLSNDKDSNKPFFMFLNYLEPHLPYEPPKPYLPDELNRSDVGDVSQDAWGYITGKSKMSERDFEILGKLYECELQYLDSRLGQLFKFFKQNDLFEDTIFIVTSDHGENIGDHGLMDHQYCLFDTLLHVPLLIRYPEQLPVGKTCDALVEIRDLYPTLCELVNIKQELSSETSEHSLLGVTDDGDGREEIFAQYVHPQPAISALRERVGEVPETVLKYDRALNAIRTDKWKLIEGSDRSQRLYKIFDESTLLNPNECSQYRYLLDRLRGTFGIPENKLESTSSSISETRESQLKDLGYL